MVERYFYLISCLYSCFIHYLIIAYYHLLVLSIIIIAYYFSSQNDLLSNVFYTNYFVVTFSIDVVSTLSNYLADAMAVDDLCPLLLTWFNYNPSMDK